MVSNTFASEYYEGDSTPDLHIITTKKSVAEKGRSWYESQGSGVRNYNNYNMFSVSTNLRLDNKTNDYMLSFIIPIDNVENLSNKVNIIDGRIN